MAFRRRYHLNVPGLLYLGLVLVLGVAAANRPGNLLVWIFAAMLSGILLSGLLSGAPLMAVRASRLMPRTGRVGEPLVVRYAVTQRSRLWPAFALSVREAGDSPGAPAFVQHVAPGETVVAETVAWPRRRGPMRLTAFRVETAFPFGLLRKSVRFDEHGECLVLPRVERLRRGALPELAGSGRSGAGASREVGAGTDFLGIREYRPGDSMRSVAWRRSVSGGELAVVERSVDAPPRLVVVLDLRRPTEALRTVDGGPVGRDLEEDAIVLAASLLSEASTAGMEVRLGVLGLPAPAMAMRGGVRHLEKSLAALASLDLDAPRDASATLPPARERSAVVVVHPDRADLSVGGGSAVHLTAAQLAMLRAGGAT